MFFQGHVLLKITQKWKLLHSQTWTKCLVKQFEQRKKLNQTKGGGDKKRRSGRKKA
jgi:hypothetical protein